MRQESQISLICPRCYTRSEAIITSDGGVVTIAFNSDHVSVNHAVTKGTLVPDPHCKHCPNPIFDHGVRFDDAYMIMCDARVSARLFKSSTIWVSTHSGLARAISALPE